MAKLARLAKEPLVHFFLLGAGIFLAFDVVGGPDERNDEIIVSAGQIERLAASWRKTWQRPPTKAELDGLIDGHIREEILYREALALGLDRNDTVIRRRLRQKMEFLSADLLAGLEPTEDELQDYLDKNSEAFLIEPGLTFQQIYINADRRGEAARDEASALIAELNDVEGPINPEVLGDAILLERAYEDMPVSEVDGLFGRGFATRLASVPTGTWAGPLESGYGLHVVLVTKRTEARMPKLADIRAAVTRDLRDARRRASEDELYARLRARYRIVVEQSDRLAPGPDLARADKK